MSIRSLNRNRLVFALICVLALGIAACQPAATPTPTARPTQPPPTATEAAVETEAPVVEETEVEETVVPVEETVAPVEETEAETEEAGTSVTEAPTSEAAGTEESGATAEASAEASGEGAHAVVSVTTTRLRAQPSLTGEVITELSNGTEVTVLGETANAGYAYARLADGTEGWVAKQTLMLDDPFADLPVMTPQP
jgi:uncharacterized protein YgiM (DUF1202 family)